MVERFEYWQSGKDGLWYFHLKAPNNEIIAQSQGYTTKDHCMKGIDSVKAFAAKAEIKQKI